MNWHKSTWSIDMSHTDFSQFEEFVIGSEGANAQEGHTNRKNVAPNSIRIQIVSHFFVAHFEIEALALYALAAAS